MHTEQAGTGALASVTLNETTPDIATVTVDLLSVIEDIVGPEFPSLSGSFLDGDITYNLLTTNLVAGIAITQQFQFVPTEIDVLLAAPWGASVTIPLGQSATFQVPADWSEATTISATYSLQGNLINQTGFVGNVSLNLSALSGGVSELGSFGPFFNSTFPIYTSDPLYIFNPGGPTGFALQGFNTPRHDVAIAHGTATLVAPGDIAIDAGMFSANDAALVQSALEGLAAGADAFFGTNVYDPAAGTGQARAEAGKLNIEVVSSTADAYTLGAGFSAGILGAAANGGSLTGNAEARLLAAAPHVGGTATLTAGGNELMVAGQDGDVRFDVSQNFHGSIAGLEIGDSITVSDFAATGVSLQGSVLVFSGGFWGEQIFQVPVSGQFNNAYFQLTSTDPETGTTVTLVSPEDAYSGFTDVYLEAGATVRSQETNLGDLAADSGIYALKQIWGSVADARFIASLYKGGSIGASIGTVDSYGHKGAPVAERGIPAGAISPLALQNALAADAKVMVFDTTAAGLKAILEHSVSAGGDQARFGQVGGIRFSYDPDHAVGSRVDNVALVDEDGAVIARVVEDGVVSSLAPAVIAVVTSNFTANGGDGYPIKDYGRNFRFLLANGILGLSVDAALDFTAAANVPTNAMSEQDAFQVYMLAHHGTLPTAFNVADLPEALDLRSQNLNERSDGVFQGETVHAPAGGGLVTGTAGNDHLIGGTGINTFSGGEGADTFDLGTGTGMVRDSLANLSNDRIDGFGIGDEIDIAGALIGRANFAITRGENTSTISAAGSSIHLTGDFLGGEFIAVTRGIGATAHTTVTYENYLPSLQEGATVDPSAINGVAYAPFLTGDDHVHFSLVLNSAGSLYANSLGTYTVAADGTISNVHVLFANTLAVAAGQTVDLGVPANNERLGFFLIQNGFNRLGHLPDDLSFVAPGTNTPANLNAGDPPTLHSNSAGSIFAPTFHSFSTLNPGDANQVLSGFTPGGQQLLMGFEDLPNGQGDNDFQDVVVAIKVNMDHTLIA